MLLRRCEQYIYGKVQKNWSFDACIRTPESVRNDSRNLFSIRDAVRELRDGFRDDYLIMETLKCIRFCVLERWA